MKTDLTAYDYVEEMITNLEPTPKYPSHAMPDSGTLKRKHNSAFNLERLRTSGITDRNNELRYTRGRLHAHLKLEDMRK